MGTVEHAREPCPDRILDDIGIAFSMGVVGGSAWHVVRGMRNSPHGERFLGGFQAVRMNAPRIGGSFAVWGGLFSIFDCSMVYARQKEDPWNSITAAAATGGFLQLRSGMRASARSALFGGMLFALIEGAAITLNRLTANMAQTLPLEEPIPQGAGSSLPTVGKSQHDFLFPDSPPVPQFSTTMSEGQKHESEIEIKATSGRSGRKGSWLGEIFGSKTGEGRQFRA